MIKTLFSAALASLLASCSAENLVENISADLGDPQAAYRLEQKLKKNCRESEGPTHFDDDIWRGNIELFLDGSSVFVLSGYLLERCTYEAQLGESFKRGTTSFKYVIENGELILYNIFYDGTTDRREFQKALANKSQDEKIKTDPEPLDNVVSEQQVSSEKVALGSCSWNGISEQCSAEWIGKTATVTWASDGKVTRYDFDAGTVYDSANGRTYKARSYNFNSGCIATANGETCIYR